MARFSRVLLSALLFSTALIGGCKHPHATIIDPFANDVYHKTEGWGLRKLDPKDYPDMRVAWMDKAGLERAINKSLQFLAAPSSRRFYPSPNPGDTITHDQVVASLEDVKSMLHRNLTPEQFQQEIVNRYDVYTSVGYNDKGDVWFTAYYTPIYDGSPVKTSEFQYPIYSRPSDLVTDPITGKVIGTYPSRRELVTSGKLRGLELLYFRKPIEPFIIQVQGSAKVRLPDGKFAFIGYAGSNGGEHRGLGSELMHEGKLTQRQVSLPAVLGYFDQHPEQLDEYVMRDERFVFLKVYDSPEWPAGSLGVQVTPDRSLATDKDIFPRASITFVDVNKPAATGTLLPYKGFVLDQDSGGGIRAAGRADIYMGIGPEAGKRAGRQFAQGHLFYFFLKPEHVRATPSTRPAGAPPRTPTTPRTPAGGDEMFPGAVQK